MACCKPKLVLLSCFVCGLPWSSLSVWVLGRQGPCNFLLRPCDSRISALAPPAIGPWLPLLLSPDFFASVYSCFAIVQFYWIICPNIRQSILYVVVTKHKFSPISNFVLHWIIKPIYQGDEFNKLKINMVSLLPFPLLFSHFGKWCI